MRRVGRELRLWVAVAAVVAAACSPSSTVESGSEITPATVPVTVDGLVVTRAEEPACASNWDLVEADRVVAEHELTSDERRVVDWALGRFVEAGLLLPNEIEFAFDPTAEACAGNIGNCRPPNGIAKARVCLPVPEAAHKRGVVLLHELAHLWDWAQGDGLDFPGRDGISSVRPPAIGLGFVAEAAGRRTWMQGEQR